MNLFGDTSVWSLALRRDTQIEEPAVVRLREALLGEEAVFTTGLVLQELLQGFTGPKARTQVIERFSSLPFVVPDRADHIAAAEVRNACRRRGLQVGTIDALLARLCVRHGLVMLTTDRDFEQMAAQVELRVWAPQGGAAVAWLGSSAGRPALDHAASLPMMTSNRTTPGTREGSPVRSAIRKGRTS